MQLRQWHYLQLHCYYLCQGCEYCRTSDWVKFILMSEFVEPWQRFRLSWVLSNVGLWAQCCDIDIVHCFVLVHCELAAFDVYLWSNVRRHCNSPRQSFLFACVVIFVCFFCCDVWMFVISMGKRLHGLLLWNLQTVQQWQWDHTVEGTLQHRLTSI